MPIEWSDDLVTGSFQIDTQHKQLFKIINDLLDACKKGQAKQEILKVVEFLSQYVQEHFSTEENFMEKYEYVHIAAHKKQHLEFKKSFTDFRDRVYNEGITLSLTISLTHTLVDWLTKHIRVTDKELAKFLLEKMEQKSQ